MEENHWITYWYSTARANWSPNFTFAILSAPFTFKQQSSCPVCKSKLLSFSVLPSVPHTTTTLSMSRVVALDHTLQIPVLIVCVTENEDSLLLKITYWTDMHIMLSLNFKFFLHAATSCESLGWTKKFYKNLMSRAVTWGAQSKHTAQKDQLRIARRFKITWLLKDHSWWLFPANQVWVSAWYMGWCVWTNRNSEQWCHNRTWVLYSCPSTLAPTCTIIGLGPLQSLGNLVKT